MKNFLSKISIVFLTLIIASCADLPDDDYSENNEPTQIRIVDLQGKPHAVTTRTPDLNLQALEKQGKKPESYFATKNEELSPLNQPQNQVAAQNPIAQSAPNYGDFSSQAIQKTLQPQQPIQGQSGVNPIVGAPALSRQNQPAVEYDLAKTEEEKMPEQETVQAKKPTKKSSPKIAVQTSSKKGLFVQVGSFSSITNAKQKLAQMEKFHHGRVEAAGSEKKIYRVLLGPFTNKVEARKLVQKITNSGGEAVLMRNK